MTRPAPVDEVLVLVGNADPGEALYPVWLAGALGYRVDAIVATLDILTGYGIVGHEGDRYWVADCPREARR